MIVGGTGQGPVTHVDIFDPALGTVCRGNDLPVHRSAHTAGRSGMVLGTRPACCVSDVTVDGVVLCGGFPIWDSVGAAHTSCSRLAPGAAVWQQDFATISSRLHHTSWVTGEGKIILLGGRDSAGTKLATTEVVGVGPSFPLQRAAT